MMEHSIIKLDRPYPIVLYHGSLYLQVGSLFINYRYERRYKRFLP